MIRYLRRSSPVDGSWRQCWRAETFKMIHLAIELFRERRKKWFPRLSIRGLVFLLVRACSGVWNSGNWDFVLIELVRTVPPVESKWVRSTHMRWRRGALLFVLGYLLFNLQVLVAQVMKTVYPETLGPQKAKHDGGKND